MTIKERREALDFTQMQVAKAVGIDQGSISTYENGKVKPKYEIASRLADLFGCTIREIMDGCVPPDEESVAEPETIKTD